MKKIIKAVNELITLNNKCYRHKTYEEFEWYEQHMSKERVLEMLNLINDIIDKRKIRYIDDDVTPDELVKIMYGIAVYFKSLDVDFPNYLINKLLESVPADERNEGHWAKEVERIYLLFDSANNSPACIKLRTMFETDGMIKSVIGFRE